MRREERGTVQGPVKKQQPDGMSHRGQPYSTKSKHPPATGAVLPRFCRQFSLLKGQHEGQNMSVPPVACKVPAYHSTVQLSHIEQRLRLSHGTGLRSTPRMAAQQDTGTRGSRVPPHDTTQHIEEEQEEELQPHLELGIVWTDGRTLERSLLLNLATSDITPQGAGSIQAAWGGGPLSCQRGFP